MLEATAYENHGHGKASLSNLDLKFQEFVQGDEVESSDSKDTGMSAAQITSGASAEISSRRDSITFDAGEAAYRTYRQASMSEDENDPGQPPLFTSHLAVATFGLTNEESVIDRDQETTETPTTLNKKEKTNTRFSQCAKHDIDAEKATRALLSVVNVTTDTRVDKDGTDDAVAATIRRAAKRISPMKDPVTAAFRGTGTIIVEEATLEKANSSERKGPEDSKNRQGEPRMRRTRAPTKSTVTSELKKGFKSILGHGMTSLKETRVKRREAARERVSYGVSLCVLFLLETLTSFNFPPLGGKGNSKGRATARRI